MSKDRNYTNLLAHLHRPAAGLPLETIQGALSYHLAHAQPSPVQLSAAAISSPLFQNLPFNLERLQTLSVTFRHAVHIFYTNLSQPSSFTSSLFNQSIPGGQPLPRLACYGGLLAGLEDLRVSEKLLVGRRDRVEAETVVALAEVMDLYQPSSSSEWEKDWRKSFPLAEGANVLSLSMIMASYCLIFDTLSGILCSTIVSGFASGAFLSSFGASASTASGKLLISTPSPFTESLQSLVSAPVMTSIASISKLLSLTLSLLIESRPEKGIPVAHQILQELYTMTHNVEMDWKISLLATVADVEANSREITITIWNTLKTMLFSIIMISDAALSPIVFIPPSIYAPSSTSTGHATPSSLSLPHSSDPWQPFIRSSNEGFKELKKTFYIALDILGNDNISSGQAEKFVRETCKLDGISLGDAYTQSKKGYLLACIEQLVPVISGECIQDIVFPICGPYVDLYLVDQSLQIFTDIYRIQVIANYLNLQHSVVLAVFAAHAVQSNQHSEAWAENKQTSRLTERMVPFYTQCLIELQLAYSALVRSASATGATLLPDEPSYALAWYCIETLLGAIREETKATGILETDTRLHRLHLMLISSVSSLPLTLLSRCLDEIRTIIISTEEETARNDLIDSLFREITENVGDMEKELVMKWWHSETFSSNEQQPMARL
ncbi:hypothetical protein C8J56DRAFT_1038477 [Mycena floridula]|nr:hypothetical protein C8J56DRAFT_1038477 [Mycena floridula]